MNSKVLFVDVDTQEDFVASDGRLSVPGADALRANFAALTRFAATHAIPLLSSADAHAPDDPEFGDFPPHCVAGSEGARKVSGTVIERAVTVAPDGSGLPASQPGQVILQKTTFSLFSNPAADRYLERFRPERVVVYGVATDYCVRQAVEGLRERGFDVTVVSDAIAGVTPDGSREALDAMAAAGVRFASTGEIVAGAPGSSL
jgi:nicotinamidase/pyrazinamidase